MSCKPLTLATPVVGLKAKMANRWTAKEAAYKAAYPVYKGTWKDVSITKAEGNRPILIHNVKKAKVEMPRLHLSVSHDGDYVTSFVVAEHP